MKQARQPKEVLEPPPILDNFRYVAKTGPNPHETDTPEETMYRTMMRENPSDFADRLQKLERIQSMACAAAFRNRGNSPRTQARDKAKEKAEAQAQVKAHDEGTQKALDLAEKLLLELQAKDKD